LKKVVKEDGAITVTRELKKVGDGEGRWCYCSNNNNNKLKKVTKEMVQNYLDRILKHNDKLNTPKRVDDGQAVRGGL
jgi:hypothetical protein